MSSESVSDNYYKILEVNENSSNDEIKKAFRRLSLKYHPDKNPNSVFFTKINEAYQTLSDDIKRREYDNKINMNKRMGGMGLGGMGFGGIRMGGMHPGFPVHFCNIDGEDNDLNNIFNEIFSNFRNMNINRFSEEFKSTCENQDGFVDLNRGGVFMTSFPGEMSNNQFFKSSKITGPKGNLFDKPVPIVKNINITMTQVFNGSQIPVVIDRWINENGTKTFENETIYIKIPCGVDNNEMLLLKDKGNVLNHNCRGDVKIFFTVENDSDFKRVGLDLVLTKKISLQESLCGFKFELKYFNNKIYTIYNNIGNIINPGFKKVVPNMGLTRENDKGNLIIHFEVVFPSKISIDTLNKLNDVFNEEYSLCSPPEIKN